MKLWIARDRSGLWLYTTKPLFDHDRNEFEAEDGNILYIDDDIFPEVTFENSPQLVELKLVKEE
jgi:hypothetical protein